ncbi:MAG: outer membrane lipoprotein chaperone LolA [Limnohabitans sp.]
MPFPDRRQFLATLAALLPVLPARAQADGLALLGQFLQLTRSGRARFTQVVTSPPKAGQAARQRSSSGVLEFQRPGRFRFSYHKPFEQTLVADGQTLWLHDPDLQQVTARPQGQALGSTPLALIIANTDLAGLQKDFELQAEPARDGLQWVRAKPRRTDGQMQYALAGLRAAERGPELAALEVLDALGQRSVLSFSGFETNPTLRPGTFEFRPPAGTDVIRP